MQTTKRVLVVEDDDDIRGSLMDALEDHGVKTWAARNGREALDLLVRAPELPGLIVLDYMMPVMDGAQFLAAQRQDARLETIPVALISASAQYLAAESGRVAHVLKKPIDLDALLNLARRYCEPSDV